MGCGVPRLAIIPSKFALVQAYERGCARAAFEAMRQGPPSLQLQAHFAEGNIVEVIAGPFKGEKARVQRIDEGKEEVTVELFEAMVPIPITVRGDHVRVLEKEPN